VAGVGVGKAGCHEVVVGEENTKGGGWSRTSTLWSSENGVGTGDIVVLRTGLES
jgi:hypothetical protein